MSKKQGKIRFQSTMGGSQELGNNSNQRLLGKTLQLCMLGEEEARKREQFQGSLKPKPSGHPHPPLAAAPPSPRTLLQRVWGRGSWGRSFNQVSGDKGLSVSHLAYRKNQNDPLGQQCSHLLNASVQGAFLQFNPHSTWRQVYYFLAQVRMVQRDAEICPWHPVNTEVRIQTHVHLALLFLQEQISLNSKARPKIPEMGALPKSSLTKIFAY